MPLIILPILLLIKLLFFFYSPDQKFKYSWNKAFQINRYQLLVADEYLFFAFFNGSENFRGTKFSTHSLFLGFIHVVEFFSLLCKRIDRYGGFYFSRTNER